MTVTRHALIPLSQNADDVLNAYLKKYPNWEAVSISHNYLPNGISVFLLLKANNQLESLGADKPGNILE